MLLLLRDHVVSPYLILVWHLLQMLDLRKHDEKKLISGTRAQHHGVKSVKALSTMSVAYLLVPRLQIANAIFY